MQRFLMSFLVVFCFVLTQTAHAYTDPGSGALIWQLLMAGFVGFLFYFRQSFSWIKSKFSKKNPTKDNDSAS